MNVVVAKYRVRETGKVVIYRHRPARKEFWTLAASHEPADWIGGNYPTAEKAEAVARRVFAGAEIEVYDRYARSR